MVETTPFQPFWGHTSLRCACQRSEREDSVPRTGSERARAGGEGGREGERKGERKSGKKIAIEREQ